MDLTVIVPCYNSEKTIKRCIDSLINQTEEVRILIVNDGSKDGTLNIADQYAAKYSNIEVLSHNNIGLPQTRKAGLQMVTTKWVSFVDSDDWVEKDMMKKLCNLAEKNDAEIAVCGLFFDSENGTKISNQHIENGYCMNGIEAINRLHKRSGIYPFMCNKIFLSSFLKQFDFPTGNFLGEDYTTILPCLERTQRLCVSTSPFYHYMRHENSMSKSGYNLAYKKAFNTYKELFEKYKNNPDISGENNEMADYLSVEFSAIYVAMVRNSNYDDEVVKYIRKFLMKHIISIISEKYVELHFKISILLIAFAPYVFRAIYKDLKGKI